MPRRLLTILAVLAAALIPSRALAAPITITTVVPVAASDTLDPNGATIETLLLDQFDPALGTLMSAQLAVTVTPQFTLQLLGLPTLGSTTFSWSLDGVPNIVFAPQPALTFGACVSGCTGTGTVTGSPFSFLVGYNGALPPWVGNGAVPITITTLVSGTAQNVIATGSLTGSFTLSYVYEPAPTAEPVPEPASLLLLGSGLGAVAWRRRRRT